MRTNLPTFQSRIPGLSTGVVVDSRSARPQSAPSRQRPPLFVDMSFLFWQLVTDEWIIGYLTSHVDTQGMTCNLFRTCELRYTGPDQGEGQAGLVEEQVEICHRRPETRRTLNHLRSGPPPLTRIVITEIPSVPVRSRKVAR